jgi:DNA-binding PadR family transcriptional regulator
MALTDERKLLLLGLLRGADMHGYLLNAHLGSTTPISLKKPTAYNLLESMEKDGWVAHRDEPVGDRPRRVYTVTGEGELAFQELLRQQLGTFVPAEFPGVVSLNFLDCVPAAEAIDLLKQRLTAIEEYAAVFTQGEGENGTDNDAHHSGSMFLTIEYTRRFLDLEIRFLSEVIGELESR